MVNTKLIRSKMILKDISMEDMAKEIKVSTKTLYTRFKNGRFNSNEIEIITRLLDIEDPIEIFFPDLVTYCVTKSSTQKGA